MLRSPISTFDRPSRRISVRLVGIVLCCNSVGATHAASELVVRWHGDFYQHLWDSSFAGGSNPAVRENRWLRGGPITGAQHSQRNLDLDNDGLFDDSRVYFDFSLDLPLNPRNTSAKPNGISSHSELPSGEFFGEISADFFNYETDRIQQAFVENDGAGGELDDVGYPSPYSTPEYQGLDDYVELVRHTNGRPQKNHIGPQEDIAINRYRPDLPHPLDSEDDAADNLVAFHTAFLWRKEGFLAGGASTTVSLDAKSSLSFESTRWWENIGEARWILQSGNVQLYISRFSVSGSQDDWGATNEFVDPLGSDWARYDPSIDNVDFDVASAIWIDPITDDLFSDIQAAGVYIGNAPPSGDLTKSSLDEFRFSAKVGGPFRAADFNSDGSVDAYDLPTWQTAFGETDAGDADGDGDSGGNDFLIWQAPFNDATGTLANAVTTTSTITRIRAIGAVRCRIARCTSARAEFRLVAHRTLPTPNVAALDEPTFPRVWPDGSISSPRFTSRLNGSTSPVKPTIHLP